MQQNKQNKTLQTTIFLPKINKVKEKDGVKEEILSLQSSGKWSKTQNGDQNQIYPLIQHPIFHPFLKGFKITYNTGYYNVRYCVCDLQYKV